MADSKITALTSISTSTDPANDPLVIVDVSDTSMAATGTTKKVTLNQLLGASGTATLASATITGALTANGGVNLANATAINFGGLLTIYSDTAAGLFIRGRTVTGTTFQTQDGTNPLLNISNSGVHTFYDGAGGTRMTLNATGLGVGVSPSYKLDASATTNLLRLTSASGNDCNIVLTQSGVGNWMLYNAATNGQLRFQFGGNDRMIVDTSGNVGIGVTPSAKLDVAVTGAGTPRVRFTSDSDNPIVEWQRFQGTATNYYGYRIQGGFGALAFLNSNVAAIGSQTWTQAMTLDASGNLLVGTTTNTDAYRTNIQFSGTSVNGLIVKNLASTGGPVLLYLHDSAQTVNTATVSAEYTDSTTQRWRLYKNGGLANYQANNVNLSDVRTKTDIKPLGSYWNKIKSLEVVTFKYKDQTHSDDNIGLIAQQVESVAPELVDADGFGNTPEDGVPLKTIYTTDLYHAAIKGLQEAMTRIEALEAKLA